MDSITTRGRHVSQKGDSMEITHCEDIDAITPCSLQRQSSGSQQRHQHQHHQKARDAAVGSQRPSSSSSSSWRSGRGLVHSESDENDEEISTEALWHQMLLVQSEFGCYNSARMDAALEGADMGIPSRSCLDLLNDSIGDMPEEMKQEIEDFLEHMQAWNRAWSRKGKVKRAWRRMMNDQYR
ncbi:hypothetical protein QBC35DRAFT_477539 [Podospora australis]|uniref:Uncharacterized protein n=1 Tax=Podospora australis TaxID=1536484 RepID=A0AAN6WLQ9_9PEZI|nr:hypothetical protein QBC35DRAFT_477539 [Podospora australis]